MNLFHAAVPNDRCMKLYQGLMLGYSVNEDEVGQKHHLAQYLLYIQA